jgi:hypothetical protein
MADPCGIPEVQRERRGAGGAVIAQRQRADRHRGRARGQVAWVAERGPPRELAGLWSARLTACGPKPRGGVLMRDGRAHIDPVEEPAAGERQMRVIAGQPGLDRPVDRPVLEDRRRREVTDRLAEATVPPTVGAARQEGGRHPRDGRRDGSRRLWTRIRPGLRTRPWLGAGL